MAIQRLNYFTGQFLRETDFNAEQAYHLSMRRMHNQRTHTGGVVSGLEVTAGSGQVTVRAGMAIDADGREIIVATDATVAVTPGKAGFFVVVALDEKKTDKAVDPDPIHTETRWTESPVFDVVSAVPAGAVGLAQIASVSGGGVVTLATDYRRVFSAPAVGGDLTVGRDLTVLGNLEVQGQTTVIQTEVMRGNVELGDADDDVATVKGALLSGHSSGALQVGSPVIVKGGLSLTGAAGDLSVQGNTLLGDSDSDSITIRGTVFTGHSSGRVRLRNPLDVNGDIFVSGNVDGRDVSADGTKLDSHVANTANPHGTTAAQVDALGGSNRIVTQINAGTGVIADARIDSAIARMSSFNAASGHDHDGVDSKKVSPGNMEGVNVSVTADALNVLTGGPNSNAAALHTHPFSPADGTVNLQKLDVATRMRLLRSPLLAQSVLPVSSGFTLGGYLAGSVAFDGTFLWAPNQTTACFHKIDPATNTVVATVALGTNYSVVAFAGGALWFTKGNTVCRLDVSTHAVLASISVAPGPGALHASAGLLWVACNDAVVKIDMSSNSVSATIPVSGAPAALIMVGSFLWVACQSNNTVVRINPSDNSVAAPIPVAGGPRVLAATSATFLWVGGLGSGALSKIDVGANTVTTPITTAGSQILALTTVGNFLWAATNNGQVQKFDTGNNTLSATVSAPASPNPASLLVVGGVLWACFFWQITRVDLANNTVAATVAPTEIRGLAFDGLYLWAARFGSRQVVKVDTVSGQILATVDVGSQPHSIAYNGNNLFVTNSGSNTVSKIDPVTATVVTTIPVGTTPTGIAVNATYGTVWVANSGENTVSVFNANASAVARTVPGFTNPQAVIAEGYYICVANRGGSTVTRLSGDISGSVSSTITVPANPSVMVFDYTSIWVSCVGSNALTRIPYQGTTTTSVTLPGFVPARMCFDGTRLLALSTTEQLFKVDTVSTVYTSAPLVGYLGRSDMPAPLLFDGYRLWGVDGLQGNVWSVLT